MAQLPTRLWFQPGDGIAREVIQADIQRYLGPDALVKPGQSKEGVDGYWITAYRTLTTQMVQDLKTDSLRWRHERTQGRGSPLARDRSSSTQPDKIVGTYEHSDTHRSRQYYGPTGDEQQQPPPQQQQQQQQQAQQPAHHYPTYPQDNRAQQPHQQHPPHPHQHQPTQSQPPPAAYQTQPTYPSYPQPGQTTYVLQGNQYVPAPTSYGTHQEPRTNAYPYPTQQQQAPQYMPTGQYQDQGGYRVATTPVSREQTYAPSQRYTWKKSLHRFGPLLIPASPQPQFYTASDGRQYPIQQAPIQQANTGRRRP